MNRKDFYASCSSEQRELLASLAGNILENNIISKRDSIKVAIDRAIMGKEKFHQVYPNAKIKAEE